MDLSRKEIITKARAITKIYKQYDFINQSKSLYAELPQSLKQASTELIESRHEIWLFCEQVETAVKMIDDDSFRFLLEHKLLRHRPEKASAVAKRLGIKLHNLQNRSNLALIAFYAKYVDVIGNKKGRFTA